MARTAPQLAKLTPPSAKGLVARHRFFKRLDRATNSRLAWVSGPGGAGKTSLVASWIAHRKRRVVWYQVDAGDRDPATLFHYLGVAAQSMKRSKRRPLPHFTPEYLAGLRDFTLHYFRDFFARLPPRCVVVFDSCHEAGTDSPFQQIVAWALNEAPRGVAVICVSRNDPGEPFARWAAEAAFVHINWDDLRLDEREARQLARAWGHSASVAPALLDMAGGWAAGLVLMLRAQEMDVAKKRKPFDAQHAIFDYFASEILAGADSRTRDFLVRTAVLPVVSPPLAAQLTGFSQAADLLAELQRSHFFTERRSPVKDDAVYEYHPLFREFLLAQARAMLGADELAILCKRAGELLEQAGQIEAAIGLLIQASDWTALIRVVCEQAPVLMGQGRWQTLQGWIAAVPPTVAESQPWLLYWRGVCSCMIDPVVGQADFESAHRQFRAAGDATGALLACAGVLEASYFRLDEQKAALPWIQEMDRLLTQFPVLPPEIELRVIHGLMGVWMAQPQHPMLPRWAARAADLLRTLSDARGKAGLIAFATGYYIWAGEYALAHSVLDHFDLDRKIIEGAPLLAIGACLSMSGVAWQNAEHEEAYKMMRLAQMVANESGVHVLDPVIAAQGVYTALSAGDVAHAEEELARIRSMLNPRRKLDINHFHFLHAGVLLLRGKLAAALDIARREVPVSEALGAPFMTASYRIQFAQLLILDGQYDEARSQLAAALEFARAMPSHILKFQALMATAWAWFCEGSHAQGHEALRDGLTIGRQQNYMNCHPLWIPEMMTELFARALEAGIETDYVRRFIRKRGLEPGKHYTEEWPWPIRIHTLGRFELRLDGEPVPSTGKTKQRVLDLLKAIVAFGPHGAAMEALTAALWPDAEGDAARDALDVTLHRLRKLLGVERAIAVADGRVSLNSQCVWVDVGAFERAVEETEPGDNRDLSPEAIGRVLKLYGGHFLQGDGERHWLLTQRERLRSKFLRYVERCGEAWERGRQRGRAIELYRRALELEPLAEPLYHRLMLCYMRDGRNAEALEVCRRCRQMLSIVLGVTPSAETEALHAELTGTPFLPGK